MVVGDQPEVVVDEARQELLVDHRAVEHVLGIGSPIGAASTARVRRAEEVVVDGLVDDRRAQRRAALARRPEAAEERALDGQVEIGVGGDDHRVLAAELQARRLQVATAERADLAPDRRGAREADLVDQALVQRALQPREGRRPVGLHDGQHAVRQPAGLKERAERLAQRRRVVRGLPDDRVAAQQRRHEVPGRDRHREVAGGDDRRDADRHAEGEQLLVGHLARHGLAVEPPALAEEEVTGVDDLLDLAERLGVRLADLARDEAGERLLVGLDDPADLLDRAPAARCGRRGPPRLGRAGGAGGGDERVGVGHRTAPRRHLRRRPGWWTDGRQRS